MGRGAALRDPPLGGRRPVDNVRAASRRSLMEDCLKRPCLAVKRIAALSLRSLLRPPTYPVEGFGPFSAHYRGSHVSRIRNLKATLGWLPSYSASFSRKSWMGIEMKSAISQTSSHFHLVVPAILSFSAATETPAAAASCSRVCPFWSSQAPRI